MTDTISILNGHLVFIGFADSVGVELNSVKVCTCKYCVFGHAITWDGLIAVLRTLPFVCNLFIRHGL